MVGSWTLGKGNTAGENTLTASAAGLPNVTFTASATTAPTAPIGISATAGNAEVMVSWTAPTNTGGLAITGFTVTGDVTECTITGLTNGTEYTFTVVANNAERDSPPSGASESLTPTGPPGGPSQVQVEPVPLIPAPTLGIWALFSLMLLLVAMPG
ncbi:MAG: fibronectin type III domain-containing protein [Desulfuromonadales bacterium]|nr:fibronectin type III domain-containing protein [Desulfuromonadales bacterium]